MLEFMADHLNLNKRPEVSTPYDPVHRTHVGFNSSTGEFTGLPKEWQQLLQDSGISKSDQEKNPLAVMEVVKYQASSIYSRRHSPYASTNKLIRPESPLPLPPPSLTPRERKERSRKTLHRRPAALGEPITKLCLTASPSPISVGDEETEEDEGVEHTVGRVAAPRTRRGQVVCNGARAHRVHLERATPSSGSEK